jgi:uncharacterized protein (DUF2141 family)
MRSWVGRLVATFALACAGAASASVEILPCHGTPTPYRLLVTTQGVRTSHGFLVANLYGSDRRRWLADNGWLNVWRDLAIPGDETMCLYLPAPGRYALVMFHDANADGDLNLGPLGPKEGYGFSNNVRPFLAPPSLASTLFTVGPGDTRISIRLRYPPLS